MIATQYINSVTSKPISLEEYETINVLKWNNSKWKNLCPYLLKTDDGILFENFYQGCKVYDVVFSNEVYASKYHTGNPKYLWWKYQTISKNGDILIDQKNNFHEELYLRWRDSLWNCQNPVRYPNGIHNRHRVKFSLFNGKKLNYLEARKQIYFEEYIRLIKHLPEYEILLNKLRSGINIMICEIDVPCSKKKGEYGIDCDGNICIKITKDKLEKLLNDPNEAFGHGLCLAYSLLCDL